RRPSRPSVRAKYVPKTPPRQLGAAGDQVRIAFGYAENGDPAVNLYCTSRRETCWTIASATDSNPLAFCGKSQQKTASARECNVPVPAIAGRVLFYRVERTSAGVTTLGPLEVMAVP